MYIATSMKLTKFLTSMRLICNVYNGGYMHHACHLLKFRT